MRTFSGEPTQGDGRAVRKGISLGKKATEAIDA
jgi:hypothetical protein